MDLVKENTFQHEVLSLYEIYVYMSFKNQKEIRFSELVAYMVLM
jgi:hypothetical protein